MNQLMWWRVPLYMHNQLENQARRNVHTQLRDKVSLIYPMYGCHKTSTSTLFVTIYVGFNRYFLFLETVFVDISVFRSDSIRRMVKLVNLQRNLWEWHSYQNTNL